jgi:glucokinase
VRGGVDLGGTKIQAVVVDEGRSVVGQSRRPTPTHGGPPGVTRAIAATLRAAAEDAGAAAGDLAGVGVGSPGVIDGAAGTVTSARNLPDWDGEFALGGRLAEDLGVRVALANDVTVATTAEAQLGAGRPFSSFIGVFWGTGVGAGLVLDGQSWDGREGAGEIGHMVIKLDGRRCPCGRRGCVEAYAGRAGMETHARKRVKQGESTKLFHIMERHGRTRLTSGVWARALARRDPLAIELLDEAVAALGAGVASAINLLDLEAVVVGGGLGLRLGQPYLERIGEAMLPHLFRDQDPPALRLAELGDLGGAVGASLLVAD